MMLKLMRTNCRSATWVISPPISAAMIGAEFKAPGRQQISEVTMSSEEKR